MSENKNIPFDTPDKERRGIHKMCNIFGWNVIFKQAKNLYWEYLFRFSDQFSGVVDPNS